MTKRLMWQRRHIAGTDGDPLFHAALQAEIARRRRREFMQRIVRVLSNITWAQMVYYVWFFCGGLYNVAVAGYDPPLTLSWLPLDTIKIWDWFNIVGPVAGVAGILMERSRFNYTGLCVQIIGNTLFGGSLIAYNLGTLHAEPWGHGMYGVFLGGSALTSTLALVLRDTLRIILRRDHR